MSFAMPARSKREPGRRAGGLARIFMRSMNELKENKLARNPKKETGGTNSRASVSAISIENDLRNLHGNKTETQTVENLPPSSTNVSASCEVNRDQRKHPEEKTETKTSECNNCKSPTRAENNFKGKCGSNSTSRIGMTKQTGPVKNINNNYGSRPSARQRVPEAKTNKCIIPNNVPVEGDIACKVTDKNIDSVQVHTATEKVSIKSEILVASRCAESYGKIDRCRQDRNSCIQKRGHRRYSQRRHSNNSQERVVEELVLEDWSSDLLEVDVKEGIFDGSSETEKCSTFPKCNEGKTVIGHIETNQYVKNRWEDDTDRNHKDQQESKTSSHVDLNNRDGNGRTDPNKQRTKTKNGVNSDRKNDQPLEPIKVFSTDVITEKGADKESINIDDKILDKKQTLEITLDISKENLEYRQFGDQTYARDILNGVKDQQVSVQNLDQKEIVSKVIGCDNKHHLETGSDLYLGCNVYDMKKQCIKSCCENENIGIKDDGECEMKKKSKTVDSMFVRTEKNGVAPTENVVLGVDDNGLTSKDPQYEENNEEKSEPIIRYRSVTEDCREDKKDQKGPMMSCDDVGDVSTEAGKGQEEYRIEMPPLRVPVCDIPVYYSRHRHFSDSSNTSHSSSQTNKATLKPSLPVMKSTPWRDYSSASSDSSYTARNTRPRPKKPKRKSRYDKSMARGHTLTVSPIQRSPEGSPPSHMGNSRQCGDNIKSAYDSMIDTKIEAMTMEMKAKVLTPSDNSGRTLMAKPIMYRDSLRAMKQGRMKTQKTNESACEVNSEQKEQNTLKAKPAITAHTKHRKRNNSESTGCKHTEHRKRNNSESTEEESSGSRRQTKRIFVSHVRSDKRKDKTFVHPIKPQVSSEPRFLNNSLDDTMKPGSQEGPQSRYYSHTQSTTDGNLTSGFQNCSDLENVSNGKSKATKIVQQTHDSVPIINGNSSQRYHENSKLKNNLGAEHSCPEISLSKDHVIQEPRHLEKLESQDHLCQISRNPETSESKDQRNTFPICIETGYKEHCKIEPRNENASELAEQGAMEIQDNETVEVEDGGCKCQDNSEYKGQCSKNLKNQCYSESHHSDTSESVVWKNDDDLKSKEYANAESLKQNQTSRGQDMSEQEVSSRSSEPIVPNNSFGGFKSKHKMTSDSFKCRNSSETRKQDNWSQGHNSSGARKQDNSSQGHNSLGTKQQDNSSHGHNSSGTRKQDNSSRGHNSLGTRQQDNSSHGHNSSGTRKQDNSSQGHNSSWTRMQKNLPQGHNCSEPLKQDNLSTSHNSSEDIRKDNSSQDHNSSEPTMQDNLSISEPKGSNNSEGDNNSAHLRKHNSYNGHRCSGNSWNIRQNNLSRGHNSTEPIKTKNVLRGPNKSYYERQGKSLRGYSSSEQSEQDNPNTHKPDSKRPNTYDKVHNSSASVKQKNSLQNHNRTEHSRQHHLSESFNRAEPLTQDSQVEAKRQDKRMESVKVKDSSSCSHRKNSSQGLNRLEIISKAPNKIKHTRQVDSAQDQNCSDIKEYNCLQYTCTHQSNEVVSSEPTNNSSKSVACDTQKRQSRSESQGNLGSEDSSRKQSISDTGQSRLSKESMSKKAQKKFGGIIKADQKFEREDSAKHFETLENENWDMDLLSVATPPDESLIYFDDKRTHTTEDVSETPIGMLSSETRREKTRHGNLKMLEETVSISDGQDIETKKHILNDTGQSKVSGLGAGQINKTQTDCGQSYHQLSDTNYQDICVRKSAINKEHLTRMSDSLNPVCDRSSEQCDKPTDHQQENVMGKCDYWKDRNKLSGVSTNKNHFKVKPKSSGYTENSSRDLNKEFVAQPKLISGYATQSDLNKTDDRWNNNRKKCPWLDPIRQQKLLLEESEENWDSHLLDIESILKSCKSTQPMEQVVPGGQELEKSRVMNSGNQTETSEADLHQLEEWDATLLDLNIISGGTLEINSKEKMSPDRQFNNEWCEIHIDVKNAMKIESNLSSDCAVSACEGTVQEDEGSIIPQSDCSSSEAPGITEFEDICTSDDVMESYIFLSQEECCAQDVELDSKSCTLASTDKEMEKLYGNQPASPNTSKTSVSSYIDARNSDEKDFSATENDSLNRPDLRRRKNERPPGYGTEECVCPPASIQFWTWRCCFCRWGWEPRICDIRSALDFPDNITSQSIADKDTTENGLRMQYRPRGILAMRPHRSIPPPPSKELWNQMQQGISPTSTVCNRGIFSSPANMPPNKTPYPRMQMPGSYPFRPDYGLQSQQVFTCERHCSPYGVKFRPSSPYHHMPIVEQNAVKEIFNYSCESSEHSSSVAKNLAQPNSTKSGKEESDTGLTSTKEELSSDEMQDLQLNSPKLVDYGFSETDDSEEEKKNEQPKSRIALFVKDDQSQDSDCSSEKRKLELEEQEINEEEDCSIVSKRRHVLPQSNIYHFIRHSLNNKQSTSNDDDEKKATAYVPPHRRQKAALTDYSESAKENKTFKQEMSDDRDTVVSSPASNPNTSSPGSYPWTPFWASPPHAMSMPASPLFGFHQPTCMYPPSCYYSPPDWYQGSSSTGSYGGAYPRPSHSLSTKKSTGKSPTASHPTKENEFCDVQSDVKSPKRLVLPPRIQFLERTRLLGRNSESESSSSFALVNWKVNFKEKCRTYCGTFVDSHCHLDFLFNRQGFKGTWSKYKIVHEATMPHSFEGCVAVFCHPGSFRQEGLWKEIALEEDVWLAFGCHPKNATEFSPRAEAGLVRCLQHKKVVALGEIGLDYSGIFKQHKASQKVVFIKQIQLALELNKPLVIHCREAEEDALQILEEV
ncbi:uncharacterized protein LOC132547757 [Ylistrum balloti]|uniref:uncharacterized protein LOC132547757 n=1 Tax=Ylistrum balloti TaxID=509963 RepID=UPI0029058598|nr:uncharacterized protein LOC132547757 [Ylistrum balloti]